MPRSGKRSSTSNGLISGRANCARKYWALGHFIDLGRCGRPRSFEVPSFSFFSSLIFAPSTSTYAWSAWAGVSAFHLEEHARAIAVPVPTARFFVDVARFVAELREVLE